MKKSVSKKPFIVTEVVSGSIAKWKADECTVHKIVIDNDPLVKHRSRTLLTETNNRTNSITAKTATLTDRGPIPCRRGYSSSSVPGHLYGYEYHGAVRITPYIVINGREYPDYRKSNLKKRL